ncbi:MAG: hypothetical protein NVSMB32_08520 [Actinomycetota bacterium]
MISLPTVAAPPVQHTQPPTPMPPLPEGDPEELRRGAFAFATIAAGLVDGARWAGQWSTVANWQGGAAIDYGERMRLIAQRLNRAGLALGDAGQALGELANRLADARAAWGHGLTLALDPLLLGSPGSNDDVRRAQILFARARDEADQAQASARNRLATATSQLSALARQAGARLPRPLIPVINPCGLVPQETSSFFWNNGMLPMDTVCLAWTETIIEVDGLPLLTLQPVPVLKDSGAGRNDKGRQRDPNGADGPLLTPEHKLKIRAGIRRAIVAGDEDTKFEGQVAQNLRVRGVQVTDFKTTVFTRLGTKRGEIDIETQEPIIEVTTSESGKLDQAVRFATDAKMNPAGKQVIVYSTKYTAAAEKALAQSGVRVARSMDELLSLLRVGRG